MTWNYGGSPATSQLDAVRFLVGDTQQSDQLLQDGEVGWLLSEWPDAYWAAAAGATQIAAQFAREVSYSADGVQTGLSELQQKYEQLAVDLRKQAVKKGRIVAPYVGGISISDKESLESNTDATGTFFQYGMNDNIEGGTSGPVEAYADNPLTPGNPNAVY